MDEPARIALNVDSAMFGAGMLPFQFKASVFRFTFLWTDSYSYANWKRGEAKESVWKRF